MARRDATISWLMSVAMRLEDACTESLSHDAKHQESITGCAPSSCTAPSWGASWGALPCTRCARGAAAVRRHPTKLDRPVHICGFLARAFLPAGARHTSHVCMPRDSATAQGRAAHCREAPPGISTYSAPRGETAPPPEPHRTSPQAPGPTGSVRVDPKHRLRLLLHCELERGRRAAPEGCLAGTQPLLHPASRRQRQEPGLPRQTSAMNKLRLINAAALVILAAGECVGLSPCCRRRCRPAMAGRLAGIARSRNRLVQKQPRFTARSVASRARHPGICWRQQQHARAAPRARAAVQPPHASHCAALVAAQTPEAGGEPGTSPAAGDAVLIPEISDTPEPSPAAVPDPAPAEQSPSPEVITDPTTTPEPLPEPQPQPQPEDTPSSLLDAPANATDATATGSPAADTPAPDAPGATDPAETQAPSTPPPARPPATQPIKVTGNCLIDGLNSYGLTTFVAAVNVSGLGSNSFWAKRKVRGGGCGGGGGDRRMSGAAASRPGPRHALISCQAE